MPYGQSHDLLADVAVSYKLILTKLFLQEAGIMKRRRTREGLQSNSLRDLGVGQDVPVPDFSDQPDSGGRIGGVRGTDEFGIEGGASAEWSVDSPDRIVERGELIDRAQAGVEGIDEFSIEAQTESWEREGTDEEEFAEEIEEVTPLPTDLCSLIEYRLKKHDRINAENVSIRIESPGVVILNGRVRSESESLRVSEVVSALPGVYAVNNRLVVPR